MKKKHFSCLAFFVCFFIIIPSSHALFFKKFAETPITNNGKKWRIGYYEGGPYVSYQDSLKATVKALMEAGWIEKKELPKLPGDEDTRRLWQWLATEAKSSFLSFEEDAYWNADWNDEKRIETKQTILKRLSSIPDLDMVFAMGTWAGQDLAVSDHSVPVVVMSTSNPLQAGIIKAYEKSGYDHVHAKCTPTQYIRQIRFFHDLFDFKRLGIVYPGTPEGEIYANLPDARKAAEERGFDIDLCVAPETNVTPEKTVENVATCFKLLAPEIDAMYISDINGAQAEYMPEMLEPMLKHKVPTWTARGETAQIRRGVLLSIYRENLDELGRFYCSAIAKIFNGAKPGELKQIFEETFTLAINLEVAKNIGYTPPKNVLKIAKKQFTEIETGPKK